MYHGPKDLPCQTDLVLRLGVLSTAGISFIFLVEFSKKKTTTTKKIERKRNNLKVIRELNI